MTNLFLVLFFISLICLIAGLISPSIFTRFIKREITRKKIGLIFGIALLVFFVLIGETHEPKEKVEQPIQPEETKEITPEITQPPVQEEIPESQEVGLSEEKRKEIFLDIVKAEDRALKEAEEKYPFPYYEHLQVGQEYQLSKETPLMPELEPTDPFAALQQIKYIPVGGTIKILQVATKQGSPWYYVNVAGIGLGWINSIALMGQFPQEEQQLDRQSDLWDALTKKYKNEVVEKYGITDEQLLQITVEGVKKNWK